MCNLQTKGVVLLAVLGFVYLLIQAIIAYLPPIIHTCDANDKAEKRAQSMSQSQTKTRSFGKKETKDET